MVEAIEQIDRGKEAQTRDLYLQQLDKCIGHARRLQIRSAFNPGRRLTFGLRSEAELPQRLSAAGVKVFILAKHQSAPGLLHRPPGRSEPLATRRRSLIEGPAMTGSRSRRDHRAATRRTEEQRPFAPGVAGGRRTAEKLHLLPDGWRVTDYLLLDHKGRTGHRAIGPMRALERLGDHNCGGTHTEHDQTAATDREMCCGPGATELARKQSRKYEDRRLDETPQGSPWHACSLAIDSGPANNSAALQVTSAPTSTPTESVSW